VKDLRFSAIVAPASGTTIPVFRLLLSLLLALSVIYTYYRDPDIKFLPSVLRQTSPLPTVPKPSTWITSQQENIRVFGSVTVAIPAGFTQQGGANVIGDTVPALTIAGKAPGIVPGTEFALGIWPTQDQTLFLQPLEFKFVVDAAKVPPGEIGSYTIKMFKPSDESWLELPTRFDSSVYALVVSVKEFTPVPKDYKLGWGWRTFFGVFRKGAASSPASPVLAAPSGNRTPKTNRSSNLRSGPGITYGVVGFVRSGTLVEPVGKTADGRWYQLSDGRWIAAYLVDNAPDVPVLRSTPLPPPTRTATPTPRTNATPTPTPNLNSVVATAVAATLTARAPTPTRTRTPTITSTPRRTATSTPTLGVNELVATAVAATLTAQAKQR